MNRRKLLVSGLCSAAVVSLSSVGAYAEEKIAPKTLEFLEATTISGYVQASYSFNVKKDITNRNKDHLGGTSASGAEANRIRAFDNNIGFTLNAVKLVFEKPLGEGDWAAGYRADLLFGQDAERLAIAEGSGSPFFDGDATDATEPGGYGLYIEQGYVAFRVPVGNGIDFKAGRFVSLSGYEVIEGPANLNFSRGLLFTWATPIGHTGLLGSYRLNDNVDMQVGAVNGWNTWATDNETPAIIGRIGLKNSSGTMSLGVSGYYGQARQEDTEFGAPAIQDSIRWFVDGVANFKPHEKILLGLEGLIGNQKLKNYGGASNELHDQWWGAAAYAKVQLTDKVSIAGRGEYLNDSDGWLFDSGHASFDAGWSTFGDGNRTEVWSMTGTIAFDVWRNMLLRLEARWDQFSIHNGSDDEPFHPKEDQLTLSVDAVYSF